MSFLLLFLALGWLFINVYFLPFTIWDGGVVRPWYILNGLLPYHDFTWIRMPLDLFLLSGWYKIFGVSPNSYQLFCFFLYSLVTVLLFFVSKAVNPKYYKWSFIFFIIFLFPLFQNTEEGELLIGAMNLLVFFLMYKYLKNQSLKYLFLLGLTAGISFVIKQNSALVAGVAFLTVIANNILHKKSLSEHLTDSTVFIISSLIPFLTICTYFLYKGIFADFFYYTILFLLGSYSKDPTLFGDGLLILGGYTAILIAFIIFRKKMQIQPLLTFFLFFQTIALFSSLFPSYLSYRAFTSYPLVSIAAGYIVALLFKNKNIFIKLSTGLSLIIFLAFISSFIKSYKQATISDGFSYGRHLASYGETEYEIANLIKSKTDKDEKIINYGSEMIYLLSDRLPKNKYVEPIPVVLRPYDVSSRVFIYNPPKIMVYDESLPADQPGLEKWPFLEYLRKNYKIIGRYNETLVVFEYDKK